MSRASPWRTRISWWPRRSSGWRKSLPVSATTWSVSSIAEKTFLQRTCESLCNGIVRFSIACFPFELASLYGEVAGGSASSVHLQLSYLRADSRAKKGIGPLLHCRQKQTYQYRDDRDHY